MPRNTVQDATSRLMTLALTAAVALAAWLGALPSSFAETTVTRDGGNADWLCCADRNCATVISQHADEFRVEQACGKLTDTDGVRRWVRSNAFRIDRTIPLTSPSPAPTPPPAPTPVPAPPTTGEIIVSWTPPTRNTDGTLLTDLSGYEIAYGTAANALTTTVVVSSATATEHTLPNLPIQTYYFAMRSFNTAQVRSNQTNVASGTPR